MAKIKVLFITSYAGCSRTWKMAKTLSKSGFDVYILEWDRDSRLPTYEKVDKISVYRFRIKASYGLKLMYLLPLWWLYVGSFCLLKRFDVVQPQNLDNLIPVLLSKQIRKFKIVYDIADFYADAYIPAKSFLLKKLVRCIDLLLMRTADSTLIADEVRIKQIGFKPQNLYVIYNSPPDVYPNIASDAMFSKNDECFRIFYGGIISEDRGLYQLVKACQKISNVTLIVAGFGSLENHFSNFIRDKKNILFLRRISYEQVLTWSMKCDCLVALYDPSIPNNLYASPNKLFEAMMCAKPIIVSAGTAMADKVARHKCGVVVNYGDVNGLINAIEKLKNDRNLAILLGKNGRTAYLEKYNWNLMEERLLKLVEKVLNKSKVNSRNNTLE